MVTSATAPLYSLMHCLHDSIHGDKCNCTTLLTNTIFSCMLTSNEWKVVDNPLEAGLTLFIVIILLKENVH